MIQKRLSPKGKSMRVTFQLPSDIAKNGIAVAGCFNEWDTDRHVMKLDNKKGVWTTAISFSPGTTVEFRYCVDGKYWRNDEEADRYISNPYFSENGILEL